MTFFGTVIQSLGCCGGVEPYELSESPDHSFHEINDRLNMSWPLSSADCMHSSYNSRFSSMSEDLTDDKSFVTALSHVEDTEDSTSSIVDTVSFPFTEAVSTQGEASGLFKSDQLISFPEASSLLKEPQPLWHGESFYSKSSPHAVPAFPGDFQMSHCFHESISKPFLDCCLRTFYNWSKMDKIV